MLIDIIFGIFLSYYWTGVEMVTVHSQSYPIDRPGYVSGPWIKRFFAGAVWPIAARMNRELGWFFVCFLSGAILFTILHAVLYPHFRSEGLVVLAVVVVRVVPIISAIVNGPLAILSMVLWFVLAKPFGAKVPTAIARMQRS